MSTPIDPVKRAASILICLSLAGCASLFPTDDDKCQSYGVQFGTPQYAECRQNLEAQRSALIGAYIANRPQQPQPYVLPMPATPVPPAPRSCISSVAGQTVYTNCN